MAVNPLNAAQAPPPPQVRIDFLGNGLVDGWIYYSLFRLLLWAPAQRRSSSGTRGTGATSTAPTRRPTPPPDLATAPPTASPGVRDGWGSLCLLGSTFSLGFETHHTLYNGNVFSSLLQFLCGFSNPCLYTSQINVTELMLDNTGHLTNVPS